MQHVAATPTSIDHRDASRVATDHRSAAPRRRLAVAAVAVAVLGVSGCSSIVDRATDKAMEEGVERAVESDSGEDVELDFDSDDGTFSIETDEGSVSVDGDEGSFVVETEDGTFEGSGNEDGYVVEGDDGTVLDADFDEDDGSVRIETEDGTFAAGSGEGDWELWPSAVARPEFVDAATVAGQEQDGSVWVVATGSIDTDVQTAADDYIATLDGFEVTGTYSADGHELIELSNGEYLVGVSAADGSLSVSVNNS